MPTYRPTIPAMDPAKEAYLMELGERAFNAGLTTPDYLERESITMNHADMHYVHAGWCLARNEWWFSNTGPLGYN